MQFVGDILNAHSIQVIANKQLYNDFFFKNMSLFFPGENPILITEIREKYRVRNKGLQKMTVSDFSFETILF